MDINLLPQRKKGFFSEERLLFASRVGAISAVVLVISLSLLFFLLSRDPSVVQLKTQQSRVIAQLSLLHDKTAKYLIIVDRINKIKQLEKKRTNIGDNIDVLIREIPNGVTVTNLTMDKATLTVSLSASDVSLLGKALGNFIALVGDKKVLKTLTVEGIVSDEKGKAYILTLGGTVL